MPQDASRRDKMLRTFRHAAKITLAAIGDFNRDQFRFVRLAAQRLAGEIVRSAARQATSAAPAMPVSLYARADAAYQYEFAKWEALIDALRTDHGMNDMQRASGILSLRTRQRVEAEAVRRRVIQEEKQVGKLRRAHHRLTFR